jgi:hypothetical protein
MFSFLKDGDFFKMGLVHVVVGGGLIAVGYHYGRKTSR